MDLVTSDSMTPTLMQGDVVAWTPVKIEDVKVGDVVVFKSYVHWPDEEIIVHRVANITRDDKGNILLETKGDHNEYADQAGPHLPEPYIREDHLMGKTISVAQQPLKIPFIGYIGIWINQGLDSISQSTSSKGSASYVGVFAPLTISAVILVVLIFIVPEKAKTFKEKIHLSIFGHKPLRLKRTIATFLVAYIVFLTFIHVFAYDSVTASVGVNVDSTSSGMDFGRIVQGKESFPKEMPVINPSTMPVKGIVFGSGDMQDYASRKVFQLERGETGSILIQASTTNETKNGSYTGNIMVYSSPFWLLFPDDFIENLISWNPEATVFILDFLSAVFLTFITLFLLLIITFTEDKIVSLGIDRSWRHPTKIIIKEKTAKKIVSAKNSIKYRAKKGLGWIMRIDFSENKYGEKLFSAVGKPILAASVIVPILLLLDDKILAMFIAVLMAGLMAYFISCKVKSKIVLASLVIMVLFTVNLIIQSNLVILSKQQTTLQLMTLSAGAMGIYLLMLSILLIPLTLLSWFIIHIIRNLKERRDPLLSMEGNCDL